jgi:hypothetical protein
MAANRSGNRMGLAAKRKCRVCHKVKGNSSYDYEFEICRPCSKDTGMLADPQFMAQRLSFADLPMAFGEVSSLCVGNEETELPTHRGVEVVDWTEDVMPTGSLFNL